MELRAATLTDVPAMSRIHALSWKTAYRGIVPQQYLDELAEDRWVPMFSQSIPEGSIRAQLALVNDAPIGCVTYCAARETEDAGWGEVPSIYVLPEHFGNGAGNLLLKKAFEELRREGYGSIYLWVLEQNRRARSFYEKNGMRWNGDTMQIEILGEPLTELRYIITG